MKQPINRRTLLKTGVSLATLPSLVGLAAMPTAVLAQDAGAYKKTKRDIPRTNPKKIDVVEFFWYGCPHCYNFEPMLNTWLKTLPADVVFTKIPVKWDSKRINFEGHQKLFYTLETMGKLSLQTQVFEAMHKDKLLLANDQQIFDFAATQGLNKEQFANTFKSFQVSTKCARAASLQADYNPEGVPALGVDGKFITTASLAGSDEKALQVVDLLIRRQRQAT